MSSADFNAFGKDKYGIKAHCFAWFFGPAYAPDAPNHLQPFSGRMLPPRYGPPSAQQVPFLPLGWKPNPPPYYYGAPSPPYLPKPRIFNANLFEHQEAVCRGRLLDLFHHGADAEVMDGVFTVTVSYRLGSRLESFKVLTSQTWDKFQKEVCACMRVYQDSHLAYRQFYRASGDARSKVSPGCYGPVLPLTCAEEWKQAAISLSEAGRELRGTEVEISPMDTKTKPFKGVGGGVPILGLQLKTYYFEYPPLSDLLDMLGPSLEVQLAGFVGGEKIGEILRRAGLEYLDDFGLLSPQSLHIYEGIPVNAVRALYAGAEKMIGAMHVGLEEEIRDIEEAVGK